MDILAALTDRVLADHFTAGTLSRARCYVPRLLRAPVAVEADAEWLRVTAAVRGTRAVPYRVELEVGLEYVDGGRVHLADLADRLWIDSVCTCPVGYLCKHAAAVVLAVRERDTGPGDDGRAGAGTWQLLLDSLAEDLSGVDRQTTEVPMALQFSLEAQPYRHAPRGVLRVRPMRPGARQRWVKSNARWSDIPLAVATRSMPFEQAEALGALASALQAHQAYDFRDDAAGLASFGPQLPRLLQDAEHAGVEFLTAGGLRSVRVRDEPVELAADATTDGGATRFTLGVGSDGRLWRGDQVHLLGGTRPTAVALLDDGDLEIAALARPVPPTAARLLADGPVEVPAADLDAFRDRLSGLVPHVRIASSDGSVDIPAPPRPTLQLTVTWHSPTSAELDWAWSYGTNHRCPLGSTATLGGRRHRPAEEAVLGTVPEALRGRTAVTGGDALTLAIHDLPYLRDLDDVDVTERHRPDFREAEEPPEISFDLVGQDPDADRPRAAEGTDWLDLAVTITVGDEAVPLADVLTALTLGEDFLVLPSGLYLPTDLPQLTALREAVEAASELRERDGDRVSVGTHDLGVWAQLAEVGLVPRQAAEWVERAQALRDLTEIPRPEPVGLSSQLRSYQREGFWWLAMLHEHGLGGILADDMGLGKTLQVLALMQHAVARGTTAPFLVVAPTSVVTVWQQEAARHAPGLRVGVVRRRTDDVAAIAAGSDVVVTSYTLLRLEQDACAGGPWAGLVLDEAQHVKNHQGKTYGAVRRIDAGFRLAVTGTPFENRLMELWSLLSITVPGLYPWPRQFAQTVVRPVEKDGDDAALRRFRRRIKPFVLRRTKELVADDLPPKQEQVLDVVLHPRHRRLYDTYLAKERQRILGLVEDFDRNRVAIFSALTKLRQLALDPALVGEDPKIGSAKLDVLLEHLTEITAEGHRALVFSQFTSYLARVREGLDAADIPVTYLDGRTRDRAAVVEEFRSGEAPVFLISLKAGGAGLTLTEADYVFVLDPWWNPAAEAQAVDRAHRIGQDRHVHVYRLVSEDTIEQKVMDLKARKAELFAQVIDGDGAATTAIGADDIRELFEA